jgi:biotin operon repressor
LYIQRVRRLAVGGGEQADTKCGEVGVRVKRRDNEGRVLSAIRARGTRGFTGAAIAEEAGLCRQTVYKIIGKLKGQGYRIEGEPRLGFMARLNERAG